jgi:uroporphyrin-III C-methyltransferase
MGMRGAGSIQNELLYGLPPETPAAVIQNASLPDQRHTTCQLGNLQATIKRENMASPSVIVIGEVLHALAALQSDSGLKPMRA